MQLQQSAPSGLAYRPPTSADATGTGSATASQATASKLVLASVWSAIGQPGQTGGVSALASALSSDLSAGLASGNDLAPRLVQAVDGALDQVEQQLTAQGVNPAHVQNLFGRFRQELSDALNNLAASAAGSGNSTDPINSNPSNGSADSQTAAAAQSETGAQTATA
jgi:hypothetical protein